MGYSIAYNSGSTTPFGTFKQGTITMGLKPQEYTVSSGFTWYANATTPNDNYLIISDTYSQGWSDQQNSKPTIWRSETGTTESFVALVNQLPDVNGVTGFTDSGTAMKYLMDSGKYFVNKDNYLGIVSDGLVLNLDAGWYPSYSGSGTTWKDIKGTNNGTLTNGPTFSSTNGGSIVFDGVDDNIVVKTNPNGSVFESQSFTIESWIKLTVTSGERTIWDWPFTSHRDPYYSQTLRTTSNNIFWAINLDGVFIPFQSNNVITTNNSHIVLSVNQNERKIGLYVNGILVSNPSYSSGSIVYYNTTIRVGRAGYGGYFNGNIYNVRYYNRALTSSEVLQNYNATKGRFGL